jgi:hypothetical protein
MIRYLVQFAANGDPNRGVAGACTASAILTSLRLASQLQPAGAVVEGLPEWPKFVPGKVDGALQLGGLGPDTVASYVPLRQEDRALYTFMDERYFGASGRMGKILGPLPAAPGPQPAM